MLVQYDTEDPSLVSNQYTLDLMSLLFFCCRSCPDDTPCSWTIKTDAAVRTHLVTFQLGEVVEDLTMDGRNIKTVFTQSGRNRIVEEQAGESVNTTIVREFFKDRMEVTMVVNNVTASSVFKRN